MLTFLGKTVLVTGATGLIGSHIVDALMEMEDVNIIALSRNEEKLKNAFDKYLGMSRFSYIAQDISKPICLPEDVTIDFIFHAASPMERKVIANRPVDVINPNLYGTMNCFEILLRQCEKKGINGRLVLFSSVTVYGNTTEEDIVVSEGDTAITEVLESGSAPYSQSKRMLEVIALAYHRQFGVDVVIARLSTVYGNTRFKPEAAFYEFIQRARDGEDIHLNNPSAPQRDNIYIDDAVSALLCIAQKGITGQAYNISSNAEKGNFAAIDEIARIIADTANSMFAHPEKVKVIYKDRRKKRGAGVILDNTKLKALGWTLQTSIEDGIRATLLECR